MQITIDVPDNVAQRLSAEWGDVSHRLLEILVAEAYRSGIITAPEVCQILQLPSRLETHTFLKRMKVYLNHEGSEQLVNDIQTLLQELKTH
ncbi:MAG: UPF0175 family protein [Leptolyngbyaceae cyanobacterium RU_5_1]|nr:UPF0175 family protein [Leptolyngbyaceae cyanobacterium RU_5_1]